MGLNDIDFKVNMNGLGHGSFKARGTALIAAKKKVADRMKSKKITSLKEVGQYKKEKENHTKKTGWEQTGMGDRFIPKQFR